MTRPIRVAIVDDHPVVREGLRVFLDALDDIEVTLEAENGPKALDALARRPADVLLLDLSLGAKLDGLALFDQIAHEYPAIKVIILTSSRDPQALTYLQWHGAAGYLDKTVGPDDLLTAIRQVSQGRKIWDPILDDTAPPLKEPLTPREAEVLSLLAEGLANKEIAARLNIREKTVKVHISHILAKLAVYDRTQAVIAAHQRGLVRLSARS